MRKIVLASASPRRRELLAAAGVIFQVCAADCEEKITSDRPEEIVRELSMQKAAAVAMNFDMEECIVTAMLDQGNRIDTMEAIDRVIPFLAGDSEMIMLVCETIRKLFCMSDEGYEVFLMDLEEYKEDLEMMEESEA